MTESQFTTPPEQQPTPVVGQRRRRRSRRRNPLSKLIRRIRRRVKLRTLLIIAIVVIVVGVVSTSILVTNASSQLSSSWSSLNRILNTIESRSRTELTLFDFDRLQAGVDQLNRQLRSIQRTFTLFGPLTSITPDTRVTYELLGVAQNLTTATDEILSGLRPVLVFMVQGDDDAQIASGLSSGERLVELLEIGQESLLRAEDRVNRAKAQLASIDLSGVSAQTLISADELNLYLGQVEGLNQVLMGLPDTLTTALGLDGERTYLVLSQNNDELRPSGGYISTYGWLTMRNARVEDFAYSATTATSPNPPDETFASDLLIPTWWIDYGNPTYAAWDGSWYADFPKTADMAMAYYDGGLNDQSPVDGVIAIDITGFEMILGALGSVEMPEYGVTVTPQNFRQHVYDIRAFGRGEAAHKQFVTDIFEAIFSDWQLAEQEQSEALLQVLLQALQEKHIMLHFQTDELNDALEVLGWNGAQTPATRHDYVMVADSNVGANKSNHSIARQLTYDVEVMPDSTLNSRLSIGYDYFDSVASGDPAVDPRYHGQLDYFNQLQVFVPANAALQGSDDFTEPITVELQPDHTLYTSLVHVPYDSAERFQLRYTTPALIEALGDNKRYRLLIQKQPGTRANPMTIQVRLPANAQVISSDPQPTAQYNLEQPILDFRMIVDTDKWIDIVYRQR